MLLLRNEMGQIMAMTNAQRQAKYRERRLKDADGTGSRLNLVIGLNAHMALKRLALRYGVTVTELVGTLAMDEQRRLLDTLSAKELASYYDSVTA